jgi:phosphoribosylformylglycinamidine synthase
MPKIIVEVMPKADLLDPQGKAVHQALQQLGFNEVKSVRVGKFIRLQTEDTANLDERVKAICHQLLVNGVVEDFSYTISPAKG